MATYPVASISSAAGLSMAPRYGCHLPEVRGVPVDAGVRSLREACNRSMFDGEDGSYA